MKHLKTWICAACGSNQPITGQYPDECWSCEGHEFITDEIKIPDTARVGTEDSQL